MWHPQHLSQRKGACIPHLSAWDSVWKRMFDTNCMGICYTVILKEMELLQGAPWMSRAQISELQPNLTTVNDPWGVNDPKEVEYLGLSTSPSELKIRMDHLWMRFEGSPIFDEALLDIPWFGWLRIFTDIQNEEISLGRMVFIPPVEFHRLGESMPRSTDTVLEAHGWTTIYSDSLVFSF